MKRYCIVIFFVSAFFTQILAGSDDSLKVLLLKVKEASYFDSTRLFTAGEKAMRFAKAIKQEVKTEAEVNIYYGNYFFYTRHLDVAASYFNKALSLAQTINFNRIVTLAKIRLLYLDRERGLAQNTLAELNILLEECIKTNDSENEFEIYNFMGITHEESGDFKKAVEFYIKGLTQAELKKNEYFQATFLNNIGLLKYFLGEQEKALEDYNRGIGIAIRINNQRLLSHIKMNRCLVFVAQKQFTEANNSFNEVISYAISNKLPHELASSYVNLGSAYLRQQEYSTGINYVDSAILVFKKYNFKKEYNRAILNKSNILLEFGKLGESEKLLNDNRSLIFGSKSAENIEEFYYVSYQLMQKRKKYKEALDNYALYTHIKDSIRNGFSTKAVEELQLKYNVQKKEIELEKEKSRSLLLEKSNEKERFMKWIIFFSGLILVISIGVVAFVIYNRKMREKQTYFSKQLIIQTEEERSRIARDLHDDIGQSLSILKTGLFKTESKKTIDQKMELEIERIIDQTRQISRALYPSYIEKIGLTPSIAMLAENIQKNKNIEFSFDIHEKTEELPVATKTHLFRILQECVSNTLKHSGASALKIIIEVMNNDFVMTYIDNGNWIQQNKTVNGMGLLSIKERIKIIDGIGAVEQNQPKGFKLTVKFKS